jgi:hypothetical protein
MDMTRFISRRAFSIGGGALFRSFPAAAKAKSETVYRFATSEWNVQMAVEFYDQYSSNGFWFEERHAGRNFCLSEKGTENRDCLPNFTGSLAIARYQIRPRRPLPGMTALREHVRTIDQDIRLNDRAPFDRTIALQHGVASDIQAFGYEPGKSPADSGLGADARAPWCFLRQDLYFDAQPSAFLVIHWKHSLGAIRILDIIPGDETWPVDK